MLGPWLNKTMNQLVCSLSVYGLFLSTVSGIEVLVSTLELSESFLCSLPCLGVFIKCQSGTSTAFFATKIH